MKDIFIDFDISFGIHKVWKWKLWIFGAAIVGAVLAIVLSFQIPNEFKSTASFVPPNISSLNSMVYNSGLGYRGFEAADEEDIDRTVAYLGSRQVRDSLNVLFDLKEHYGVVGDSDEDKLFDYYFSRNNKISFSNNSTVEINCWDVDKEYSAEIANTYLQFANDFFENISQRKAGLLATREKIADLTVEKDSVADALRNLRETYKVFHMDHAGNETDKIIAAALRNNPGFASNYDLMISLEIRMNYLIERISDLDREADSRELNINQYPSLIQVTERGTPTNFKDRPKRSIIVALATFGVLIFAVFLVLLLDRSRPEDIKAS